MKKIYVNSLVRGLQFLTVIIVMVVGGWPEGSLNVAGANPVLYHRGSDRQKLLLEGARKEGKVFFYTSLTGDIRDQIVRAFEGEYPFIKVQVYRGDTDILMRRLQGEFRTGRAVASVVDQQIFGLLIMKENRMLAPFWTPVVDQVPSYGKEVTEDDKVYWIISRESYIGFGYNSKLLPSGAIPRNYVGLLGPLLKGKMALDAGTTGVRWLGGILANLGQEQAEKFLADLAGQKLFVQPGLSAQALIDLMSRGEITASPTTFQAHVLGAKAKGEPVDWTALEPVPTNSPGIGISALAPHPHAAVLFIDFFLHPNKGQRMLTDYNFGSLLQQPNFKRWYPEAGKDSKAYIAAEKTWREQLNKRFVRSK